MGNVIVNSIWPEWQVDKLLGKGSYGEVYKAVRRDQLESYAAIKVISIPHDESEVNTLRSEGMRYDETETYFKNVVNDFVKEIQLMETFKGTQNIISVEDYKVIKKENELGWDIYIRMELLTPLTQYFYDHFPDESETIKIGIDICTALEMCAKRRVIHRDIKPENIFVNSFGDFKLGDFGIARTLGNSSSSMTQAGTPYYLAPEITKSNRYDATVDLYSLGLVLYRYTNDNRLPFIEPGQSTSPSERQRALMRRFDGEPLKPPCKASHDLAEVILTACAYDPARRYKSPTEMKNALIAILNGTYKSTHMYDYFEVEQLAFEETRAVRPAGASQTNQSQVAQFDKSTENGQFAVRPRRELNLSRTPEYERQLRTIKNIKIAIAVCAVIGVLILIFGVIIPQLPKKNHETNSGSSSTVETIKYSASDEQKISEIIKEAEIFASSDDYDSAYKKIQAGLVTYPNSASLMEKKQEYYNIRYKRDTLATAKMFADMDSLPEAIATIKNAQAKQGDYPEYQEALTKYTTAYKTFVIAEADAAATNGDYISAIETLNDAVSVLGNDAELSAKAATYENSYVTDVINQADELIAKEDYNNAESLLNSAITVFPNNEKLINKKELISKVRPQNLMTVCPPYQYDDGYSEYIDGNTFLMCGEEYTNGFVLDDYNYKGRVFINLKGEYDLLEFDYGHVDNSLMWDVTLNIYLDEELKYSTPLSATSAVKHASIDVSNAQVLQIAIHGAEGWGIATGHVKYGFTNLVVSNNSKTTH